jgi:hypothetical protein
VTAAHLAATTEKEDAMSGRTITLYSNDPMGKR